MEEPRFRFGVILDMLKVAFESPASEKNYHDIVACMRDYITNSRAAQNEEQRALLQRGWPPEYDLADHMERIRFAMVFQREDHSGVSNLVQKYWGT